MSYSDLLRDPRWQRKRLEVMQRADFACELCGAINKTLNVHHERYAQGRMPWDYPPEELHCLCESCHRSEHGIEDAAEKAERERERKSAERRARMVAEWKVEHPAQGVAMDRVETLKDEMVAATTEAEKDRLVIELMAAVRELSELGGGPRFWVPFR